MSPQPPILQVKAHAEKLCPNIKIPKDIIHARAYLEGIIGYYETGGNRERRTKNPYKYGGPHYKDWEKGWAFGLENNSEPKFLKKCEAA